MSSNAIKFSFMVTSHLNIVNNLFKILNYEISKIKEAKKRISKKACM